MKYQNLQQLEQSIADTAAFVPNRTKTFFVNGTATFINGPAILYNNAPNKPPDWIVLAICVLDNFISVDILFSNTFLSLVFCFVVNNIHELNCFHQTF